MTVLLVDRHEARKIEEEEKAKWIRSVLEKIGVPLDDWPENPSMANLRKMRDLFRAAGIEIINDNCEGIEIYLNDEMVAYWRRPFYKMVMDPRERDVRYKFYYEMHLQCDSVYDQNQQESQQD